MIFREQSIKQAKLVGFLHHEHLLVNLFRDGSGSRDLDAHRLFHVISRDLRDFFRHGCGKEHGLALFWHDSQNFFDLRLKAHVEHPISLIQNQDLNLGKRNRFLLQMIDQASGSRNKNMRAIFDHPDLGSHGCAADQNSGAQSIHLSEFLEGFIHLKREFASREEHQSFSFAYRKALEHRSGKRKSLASSGLGNAD